MSTTQDAIEALDAMDVLQEQAAKTRRDLRRSLAIKQLWPEAFDAKGGVTSWARSNENDEISFTIKRKDGKKRTFDLLDVPFCLWCDGVKDSIRTSRLRFGSKARYWKKLMEHEGD